MFGPNRLFQAGLNQAEARRTREKNTLSLRRKDREVTLQNKRKKILNRNKPTINLHGVYSNDTINIHNEIIKIREILSSDSPNAAIKQIINRNMLPRIIYLLQINNYSIIYESSWCIANIVSQNSADGPEYTANVVQSGALIPLLNILKIPKYSVQERALSAIGNIAGGSGEFRDLLLKQNILQILIEIIKNPFDSNRYYEYKYDNDIPDTTHGQYTELITTLSWTIANLCRGTGNDNDNENIKHKLLIIESAYHLIKIANKLNSEKSKINLNIICSIKYIMPVDYKHQNILLNKMNELNVLQYLIFSLTDTDKWIYRVIMSIILRILEGDNTNSGIYAQKIIDYGILRQFHILLNRLINNNDNHSLETLKVICLSIGIINTYGQFGNSVMDANLFQILCKLLVKQSTVSYAALWCVANAIYTANENNNKNIIQYLLNENKCNLIKYLCDSNKMLFMNGNYEKTMEKRLNMSLDCMENICLNGKMYVIKFEEYNGLEFLEYMESVDNLSELLYDRIMIIKNEYFGCEKDSQPDTQQNYMNNNFDRMEISFDNNNRQM